MCKMDLESRLQKLSRSPTSNIQEAFFCWLLCEQELYPFLLTALQLNLSSPTEHQHPTTAEDRIISSLSNSSLSQSANKLPRLLQSLSSTSIVKPRPVITPKSLTNSELSDLVLEPGLLLRLDAIVTDAASLESISLSKSPDMILKPVAYRF
ncbi:unnamed protein product [Vicia faba]|uniref:Uncharacterized protein n=1 Tax=Vicia faba TaxID=3906 RepID=A0AAV0ZGR6_VICFA|nr:unnamed protein product [Vicia faba]